MADLVEGQEGKILAGSTHDDGFGGAEGKTGPELKGEMGMIENERLDGGGEVGEGREVLTGAEIWDILRH